jgi:3-hydroxybutyryl-CoA dehydrogenase
MNIFVYGNEEQQKEIQSINLPGNFVFTFKNKFPENHDFKAHDIFFILSGFSAETDFSLFENKPVLINAVTETLADLNLPLNISRINGWPGFLQRDIWEIASYDVARIKNIFEGFGRKIFFVKDEPGFVSARVISMIINEAFFALGENVSTTEEIDLAMKLGTNYPQGPFEWADRIGIEKIYFLLKKLSEKEERYLPAPYLKELFLQQTSNDFTK